MSRAPSAHVKESAINLQFHTVPRWAFAWRRLGAITLAAFVVCHSQALPPPQPGYIVWDAIALDDGEVVVTHTQGVFRRAAGAAWRRESIEAVREGNLFSAGGALWLESQAGLFRYQSGRWQKVSEGLVFYQVGQTFPIQSIDAGGRLWRCMADGVLRYSTDGRVWSAAQSPLGREGCARFNRYEHRHAQAAEVVTVPFGERLFQSRDAGQHWSAVPPDEEMTAQGYTLLQFAATSSGHLVRYFASSDGRSTLRQWSPGARHWSAVDLAGSETGGARSGGIHGVVGDRVFVSRWTRHDDWRVVEFRPGSGIAVQYAQFGGLSGGIIANRSGVFSFDTYGLRRFNEAKQEFEDWPGLPDPHTGAWTPSD